MSQNSYNMMVRIVASLLRKQNHVRGLARDLLTNQTTISRKVKELYEENILDYRQEGKNKVFFIKKTLEAKQYCCIVEMCKLLEALKKYPRLRRVVEVIKEDNRITLALLFGSYAKATANKHSDIDVYIDTTNRKIKQDLELIDSKLSVKIGRYDKDNPLIKEIEKNHIIIKGVEEYYEKSKFFS